MSKRAGKPEMLADVLRRLTKVYADNGGQLELFDAVGIRPDSGR